MKTLRPLHHSMFRRLAGAVLLACPLASIATMATAEDDLREQAARSLRKATEFFVNEVSTEGGYLWRYSVDLTEREGEKEASATEIWIQPPGTPTVGGALLGAWDATGDRFYLDAARRAGNALVKGQLASGGWTYNIEFDPKQRLKYAYRVAPAAESGHNLTVLDDDTTQSALRFLMQLDAAFQFQDSTIHDAAQFALSSLLRAQHANGAWPQRYSSFPEPQEAASLRASYPDVWPPTWPNEKYAKYYTFNDNAMGDVIETLLLATKSYRDPKYQAAAEKCGDFILLAQMPDPQPAWAQQYDFEMHPVWARKFEPPSVTGGESQSLLQTLLLLYRETGKEKYLQPIPQAIEYLKSSLLPDGRLARFNELKTNKPLYFTKDYQLTYSDSDMPTHYGFKVSSKLDSLSKEYDRLKNLSAEQLVQLRQPKPKKKNSGPSDEQTSRAKEAIAGLDARGRWQEQGKLRFSDNADKEQPILTTTTFVKNVESLSRFLAAARTERN